MIQIRVLASSSAANCTHINDGSYQILLDAGMKPKTLQRALGFGLTRVSAVFITHSHADHSQAVPHLLRAGVDCYMLKETAEAIGATGHRVHHVEANQQYQVGPWTVRPFELLHDVPNLGYLLVHMDGWKVLLITDTPYCQYRFEGITHALVEANYSRGILNRLVEQGTLDQNHAARVIRNHMSIENAAQLLHTLAVPPLREVHLLHLSNGNSDEAEFKRQIERIVGVPVYVSGEGVRA